MTLLPDLFDFAYILNLQNGLYNALDDSFKAHTPDYISTVQIGASYLRRGL